MTNDRKVMGERVDGRLTNILGWVTTGVTFLERSPPKWMPFGVREREKSKT
ncbi:hypothetical protein [Methylobacterium nodulans]|nr:hypothetical protein [Methylobacterium nodulans]